MGPMESAIQSMEHAAKHYSQDLEAMSEEQILGSVGGSARKPVDFTFEVALINRRLAARLNGTEPPPAPEGDDWWVAPDEYRSKSAIIDYMRTACQSVIDAAKAVPEEEAGKMVGAPGSERTAFAMVNFASMHTMYHDAQLNFIQSLSGDLAVHWE